MRALLAPLCVSFLLAGQALAYDFTCPPSDRYDDTDAYRVPISEDYFLPILASKSPAQKAHLAIVVLHGSNGNLEESFWNVTSVVAEKQCGPTGTLVVAPAFPQTECSARDWGKSGRSSSSALTWSDAREWSLGQKDDRADGASSSFHALDKVLSWVQEEWKDLRFMVVVGFSTGAQLALHWSIFSAEGVDGSTSKGLPLRTIVVSPDTVVYFNDTRPAETCAEENENVTGAFRCDNYPLPESGTRRRGTSVAKSCNGGWDDYEFGLGDLEEAAAETAPQDVADYLFRELGNSTDLKDAVRERFKSKDVRFLSSTGDAELCTSGVCSDSCAAMITGSSRLQRVLNYLGHLEALDIEPSFRIFEGPHAHLAAFRSQHFSEWGFPGLTDEQGNCSIESPSGADTHDFRCPASDKFKNTDAYRIPIDNDVFLPVLASKSPEQWVLNAIVVLHDSRRNVEEVYWNMTTTVAEQQCGNESTVVVAPAFAPATPEPCNGESWGKSGASSSQALTWSGAQEWSQGGTDDRSKGVSSFFVLDRVIEWLQEEWKSLRFIVVAGFSTGAQLALRWSIFSAEGVGGNTTKSVPLRIVVASPDTVTYLDSGRPTENCSEEAENLSTDFRCLSYPVPEGGSRRRGTWVARSCNNAWDEYDFGLGDLDADISSYAEEELGGSDLSASLRARFKTKDLRFLVGKEDTRLCGLGFCEDSCGALIMGSSRLQRMLNYMGHLEDVVGREPSLGIFEGPRTQLAAFQSSFFREWGFPGLVDQHGNCTVDSVDFSVYIPPAYTPMANAFRCPPSDEYRSTDALRLSVSGGFMPLLASKGVGEAVLLAIVVLHDEHSNVEEVYSSMTAAVAQQKCGSQSTLVVAMAFPPDTLETDCNGRQWGVNGGSTTKSLVWSDTRWTLGERDTRNRISSFDALDRLIAILQDTWPTLRSIVVTGFGAGAELALRWSIFSAEGTSGNTTRGLPLRTIVASPDTVTYLDASRPAENCTEGVESLSSDFRCTSYSLPESGSRRRGVSVARSCSGAWDDYEFGLAGLDVEGETRRKRNVASYLPEALRVLADLPAAIRERFKTKDVRFLGMADDAVPCALGTCREGGCAAEITGASRLQRLLHYIGHLGDVLGQEPSYGVVEGPRADDAAFRSNIFAEWGLSGLVDAKGNCSIEDLLSTTTSTSTKPKSDFDAWDSGAVPAVARHGLAGLTVWLGCVVTLLRRPSP